LTCGLNSRKHRFCRAEIALCYPAWGPDADRSWLGRRLQNPRQGTVQFRNAQTGEYGNLTTKGIIEVVHMVCLMRGSIARLLITTEAMVAEIPKKEPETPSMPGGGMEY